MMPPAVLFSAGLDSAVLLANAAARYGGAQPIYVNAGLAWEAEERAMATRLLSALPTSVRPLTVLTVDMRDVYPASHWALRGEAPAFDTPDNDVYLEGRNIVLLSKACVYAARAKLTRVLLGPLAGNPFPDARPEFFRKMGQALSLGLDTTVTIEAPLLELTKAAVIMLGRSLGVPFELTLSCMQPVSGVHCGRCSKCRERRDAFREADVEDPARFAVEPLR